MTVGRVELPALDLGEASATLELEDATCALDLVQVAGERVVGEPTNILPPHLVERRSQCAHVPNDIEHTFDAL
jgi:hypothetical protein